MLLPAMATLPPSPQPALAHVNVFERGESGYAMFRIPVIEVTRGGAILAFAEARRYGHGDPGMENNEIDLVLKRSTNGGRTWSPLCLVEHAGARWSAANAATVVDRATARVWLLYLRCKPGRSTETSRAGTDDMQTAARFSDDDGVTWSAPIDLTAAARDVPDPAWKGTVIGPGGGVQTRTGRLLFAAWKSAPYVPFAFYSDDGGKTWRRSAPVPAAGNECQAVELSDGSVLLEIRQNEGPHRWAAPSRDGGATWGAPVPSHAVTRVACAIERLPGRGGGALVWTGPRGPGRRTLVARVSADDGRTWGPDVLIADEDAAYSDLAALRGGALGVLWERADYRYIAFTRVPASALRPPR